MADIKLFRYKPEVQELTASSVLLEKELQNVIENKETHTQKRRLKAIFFWFIMPLYAIIILGSMFAIVYSLFIDGSQIEIVLGAVASIITSVIAIPTIIAKYLFPTGEDEDMTKMVNKMQNYDNNVRRIENNKKDMNENEKEFKEIEKDNQ